MMAFMLAPESFAFMPPLRHRHEPYISSFGRRHNRCVADSSAGPARIHVVGRRAIDFVDRWYFVIGVVAAVSLAAVAPAVGRKGGILRPEITVSWGATCGIFLLSGLSLGTHQMKAAALQWREHAAIQTFNLVAIPLVTFCVCAVLAPFGLLERSVLDGLLVMACLPTTVNMCVALTRSANGSEALAIFNAVLGNLLGVILTPTAVLLLLERTSSISVVDTLWKLVAKVLLPIICGQLLRHTGGENLVMFPSSKKVISRTSESLLLITVYSTFCDAFLRGFGLQPIKLGILMLLVTTMHVAFLVAAWAVGGLLKLRPGDRVAFMFSATQKTLALGLPLLNVICIGRADLGLVCTPLLLQHPLQLLCGAVLTQRLKRYVAENA